MPVTLDFARERQMQSTLNPTQADTPDVLVARADQELASAHEQIARADEELVRVHEQLSRLSRDAGGQTSDDPRPGVKSSRPAVKSVPVPGGRPSVGRPAVRGLTGLMLAACIGGAALAWQSSSGKQIIAKWAPQIAMASTLPLDKPGFAAQASPRNVQAVAAEAAPPQPAPLVQTAPEEIAPASAAMSPELAQLLQTMARDLATVGQGVEQLKTGQEQMARDNAKVAEQLKANQEETNRVIAKASEARAWDTKASEQNSPPNISAPRPRLTATPTRNPARMPQSPQAKPHPQAESQRQSKKPQVSSVPPPMPLH
jgi:hypothetical protein